MTLWKRAAGAIKDRKSLLAASLSTRTSLRHPDLEAAMIKATNHDDTSIDYKNAHRVFKWIRAVPGNVNPFSRALTKRINKTRCWVVALKGLLLMHGVFCLKIPLVVLGITRLPFDLSDFSDAHLGSSKAYGFNHFVRVYFAFLDMRFTLLSQETKRNVKKDKDNKDNKDTDSIVQELLQIQKLQSLLDMLLQIKPVADNMRTKLICEAMDCVMIEIHDVYGKICKGIDKILMKGSRSLSRLEAAMKLQILERAVSQCYDLRVYVQFCRQFGIVSSTELPKLAKIPDEDIEDLEKIVVGIEENVDNKQIVVVDVESIKNGEKKGSVMKTIVTDKWELFDEDEKVSDEVGSKEIGALSLDLLPLVFVDEPIVYRYEMPDLITF